MGYNRSFCPPGFAVLGGNEIVLLRKTEIVRVLQHAPDPVVLVRPVDPTSLCIITEAWDSSGVRKLNAV